MARGYLTRVLPKVYAVGHDAPDPMADLWTRSCTQVQDGWSGCCHQLAEKTRARCDTPLGQVAEHGTAGKESTDLGAVPFQQVIRSADSAVTGVW